MESKNGARNGVMAMSYDAGYDDLVICSRLLNLFEYDNRIINRN
jgi:hypothetical protein